MDEYKVIHLRSESPLIDTIITHLSKEQAEIKEKISALQKQLDENESTISELTDNSGKNLNGKGFHQVASAMNGIDIVGIAPPVIPNSALKYDPTGSWWDKVVFVLNQRRKVTYSKEILNCIYELEPGLKGDDDKHRKNGINVFALMSTNCKKGKLKRITVKGEFLYGLPQWWSSEDGKLIHEYRQKNPAV
jgi:hypothetical protein